MNKKLTPIELLDRVLECLIPLEENKFGRNFNDVNTCLANKKVIISENKLFFVLERLRKDGNAEIAENKRTYGDTSSYGHYSYYLTFDGDILIEQGGYGQAKIDAQNESRIKNLQTNLLIAGTLLAGIGSIALVVWEIYDKFHSSCH